MKRLLNVLGALVSDLTQNELAARGACRCHKFRSGGFGMELHTYGHGRRDAVAAARLVVAAMASRVYISLNKGV